MAGQAQDLLAGSGWLPEPLRTPGLSEAAAHTAPPADPVPAEAGDQIENSAQEPAADPTQDPLEDPIEEAIGEPIEGWRSAAD